MTLTWVSALGVTEYFASVEPSERASTSAMAAGVSRSPQTYTEPQCHITPHPKWVHHARGGENKKGSSECKAFRTSKVTQEMGKGQQVALLAPPSSHNTSAPKAVIKKRRNTIRIWNGVSQLGGQVAGRY